MKRIGLTGGIGVGKSTVARIFNEIGGVPTLDADQVARALRAPGGRAEPLILKRFNTTDRTQLREIITKDPLAKKDLEAILHPLIQQISESEFKRLESESSGAPFLIYEATLLIESGRAPDFDAILVVTAPLPDRLSRIMARDGISKEASLALIDSQMSDADRLKVADYRIENLGSLDDLKTQVRKTLDQIKAS